MKKNLIDLDSNQAWIRLIIIFTMSVIGTAGMWSVVIIMPNIQSEFALDRAASTYPYVATMFGYGIGNVIIGRMLDKIGITKPIIYIRNVKFCFVCLQSIQLMINKTGPNSARSAIC